MVFLYPILVPIFFPMSIGYTLLEVWSGEAALSGSNFWEQFASFWKMAWNLFVLWM